MQVDLAPAAQRHAERRAHDRLFRVLDAHVRLLHLAHHFVEHFPVAHLAGHENQAQVRAQTEVLVMARDDHAFEVLLDLVHAVRHHRDHVIVDRVHLGVDLEARDAIAEVDQRGPEGVLHDPSLLLQVRQQDRGLWAPHGLVATRAEIEVEAVNPFLLVKAALSLGQHALHDRWHLHAGSFHLLDARGDPDRVPGLERAHRPVEAPLHGVVDVDHIVRDLADALRRVNQRRGRGFPGDGRGAVLAVEQISQPLAHVGHALGRLHRIEQGPRRGLEGHGLVVQGKGLAVFLLVEPDLGLQAKPSVRDHLAHEFGQYEGVAFVVVGQGVVAVLRHVGERVQTHEVRGLEGCRLGTAHSRPEDGVDLFDRVVPRQHQLNGLHHAVDTDAVGHEVRGVLAHDHALAQHIGAQGHPGVHDLWVGVFALHDLEQFHEAHRVEEVRYQEVLLERGIEAFDHRGDRQTGGVG